MHLKTIKLAGFKSFVDPTLIPIRGSLNAIVGPNGCGKSNIVDAIRWVIGEMSAKQLRGHSMNDVIFNGTASRKPVEKASIELHFDNNDGRLCGGYAKYAEITIRREVERNGQSYYFINGMHVRRRDVVDIFLGTGLGPRNYAIVEQGMISSFVEAKPEELHLYIEETAGISKYKERRSETENRMRHTQENLDRVNDICEELAKQLRHLKRQASMFKRYKIYKEEERLLSAQIKALQWKVLEKKSVEYDQTINQQNIFLEEKQSDQRWVETEIEKVRERLIKVNKEHNAVQKRHYSTNADIARLEQRIKNIQDQTQQWKTELKENKNLWTELENNTINYKIQITELETKIKQLKSSASETRLAADEAEDELAQVEAGIIRWQEMWDAFQAEASKLTSQTEVMRIKREHYECQLVDLEKHREQLQQNLHQLRLEQLHTEIELLTIDLESLNQKLSKVQSELQSCADEITKQREINQITHIELQTLCRNLQATETCAASIETLQKSVLKDNDNQTSEWIFSQGLKGHPRLGQKLKVNAGWEIAVETVLSNYLNAICVDDIAPFLHPLSFLLKGQLTLVAKNVPTKKISSFNKAPTLISQINSDWPFQHWLAGIYIAETIEEVKQLQTSLQENESIITKDGIWFGSHWVRVFKIHDAQNGFLLREKKLKNLKNKIIKQRKHCDQLEMLLKTYEHQLAQQETDHDTTHQLYQEISIKTTRVQTILSEKQVRLDDAQQRQNRLRKSIVESEQRIEQHEQEFKIIQNKTQSLISSSGSLEKRRKKMLHQRDHYSRQLTEGRKKAYQKRKEADALEIRLTSSEDQLNLLKQSVAHDQRQLKPLTERLETLSQYLSEGNKPLETLNEQLHDKLEEQLTIETKLWEVEKQFEKANQTLRDLEQKRSLTQKALNAAQTQLEELRMQHQSFSVRQTTIQEQLNENNFNCKQVIAELSADAEIDVWQEKLDQLVQRIQCMGPINLAAIEEYESINERKNYLDRQYADLTEALEILKNAIQKIDRETRMKFKETYDRVNHHLKLLFPRIFCGGRAMLEMTRADLLTPGVIVRAQPPGKRNVTIHMLSGGEKALTAIALIFSLFHLNPAPFCILDEVDAPLDDINVGRLCQLVKEMSKEIQFLVISHNKVTIEMADCLMGVTMQEPGVSRIVSVNMEEAIAIAETS